MKKLCFLTEDQNYVQRDINTFPSIISNISHLFQMSVFLTTKYENEQHSL
jgi:hypothetical protein